MAKESEAPESMRTAHRWSAIALMGWLALVPSSAYTIEAIENAIQNLERVAKSDPAATKELSSLQDAIASGRKTIDDLRAAGAQLNQEKASLENRARALQVENARLQEKKAELERVQSALTSGLIGALITALVAIAGVLAKLGRSRVDRDYRRLEIIEKMTILQKSGVELPDDLPQRYSPTTALR